MRLNLHKKSVASETANLKLTFGVFLDTFVSVSKEILDKIRQRQDNPSSIDWREAIGEQRALKWVLRLFQEHEKSLRRRVLFEKYKKPKPREKKAVRANEPQQVTIDAVHLRRLIDNPIGLGFWGTTT